MLELFFSPARPLALFINVLLIILTVWGVVKALQQVPEAMKNEKAIQWFKEAFGSWDPDVDRTNRLIDLREKSEEIPADTLLRHRLEDLFSSGPTHEVDVAGMTALNQAALRKTLAFPTSLGPTLVLLGLLGTLWGLATSVAELSSTLVSNGSNTTGLLSAIQDTLGGMKTAFSTTLLGILGTISVRSVTGLVRNRQSQVLESLEHLLITKLVPVFQVSEKTALPEAAKALTGLNKILTERFDKLIEGVDERGRDLSKQLEDRFKKMEVAFQTRATELLQETSRAMTEVMTMLGERQEGDPSLADYVRTVRAATTDLERSVELTAGLIPEMESGLKSVIQEQRTSLQEALTAYSNRVGPILENQAEATRALVTSAQASSESMLGLKEQLRSLQSSFETARQAWERVDALIERVGDACSNSIAGGLHAFVDELKAQGQADDQERERLAAAFAGLQQTLSQTLERLQDERSAAQQRSMEILETTREVTTAGLERILTSLSDQQGETRGEIVRGLRELAAEIRDISVPRAPPGPQVESTDIGDFGWQPIPPDPDPDSSAGVSDEQGPEHE